MANDKGPLLGELEELKAVLRKQRAVDLSAIPLLDDIINEPSPSVDDSETDGESAASTEYSELSEYIADNVGINEFVATSTTSQAFAQFRREHFRTLVLPITSRQIRREVHSKHAFFLASPSKNQYTCPLLNRRNIRLNRKVDQPLQRH